MIEQLGRRAGALDVHLISNQPEERRCYRLCLVVVLELREKMENVREPRCTGCPDLTAFYWGSEGDELDMRECFGFVVMFVAAAGCAAICFELCCLIVGEIFFSLPS